MSRGGDLLGGAVAAGIGGLGAYGNHLENASVDQLNSLADQIGAGQVDLHHAVVIDGVSHSGLDATSLWDWPTRLPQPTRAAHWRRGS